MNELDGGCLALGHLGESFGRVEDEKIHSLGVILFGIPGFRSNKVCTAAAYSEIQLFPSQRPLSEGHPLQNGYQVLVVLDAPLQNVLEEVVQFGWDAVQALAQL